MTFTPDWISIPGDTVVDLLEEQGITLQDFATFAEFPLIKLQYLIAGKISIDQEIAEKLAKHLGSTPSFWLKLERNYTERKRLLENSDGTHHLHSQKPCV